MSRLFVAVDLPPLLKAELDRLQEGLPGARWVSPDQLHLTLRFIGEVDAATMARLIAALREVCSPSFTLSLKGIGHFGRPARVLWVGLCASPELVELHHRISRALAECGLPPEERPFSPHITLARFREPPTSRLATFEGRYRDYTSPPFAISEFVLYSSRLTPQGAVHTREAAYPLGSTEGHTSPVTPRFPE